MFFHRRQTKDEQKQRVMPRSSLDAIMSSVEPRTTPRRMASDIAREAVETAQARDMRMILMQGSIGCGKSTIAAEMQKLGSVEVVSADNYFVRDGVYKFRGDELWAAHAECQRKAGEILSNSANIVVVDNCNANNADVHQYISLANNKALVVRIVPRNQNEAIRCGNRSVHKVPQQSVMNTFKKMEALTGKNIITMDEKVIGL
jgi:gluconate kinase